jgi:hypothetical protein
MTTPQIAEWTHPRATSRRHAYRYLRDVLERYCVRVGRGAGRGPPILWKLRDSNDRTLCNAHFFLSANS